MSKIYEEVESAGVYRDDCVSPGHFLWFLLFFRTALPRSGGLSPGEGGMQLHDAVGVNCKKWHNQ